MIILYAKYGGINEMRNFILGTDWGEDVDDAIAVRLLARAHKEKRINLLGIGINTLIDESYASLYAFLKNEGVSVPIGVDKSFNEPMKYITYQKRLASYESDKNNDMAFDSVKLYRKAISEADGPVEIIEIGFLQVVANVLKSGPDEISDKTGYELFKEKVKKMWIMAGNWTKDGEREYNFCHFKSTREGSAYLCDNCPCEITFLGWEIGSTVHTGNLLKPGDYLYDALHDYGCKEGRDSWDPMTAMLALIGDEKKAGYDIVKGKASVSTEDGSNYFVKNDTGIQKYVIKIQPDDFYANMINEEIK